jgi:beta-N-acetylhexosaminidase
MLLVGFRGLTVDDTSPIVADIRDRGLGGVVLFDFDTPTNSPVRNIESSEQLRSLVAELKSAAAAAGGPVLLVSIDEEGGRVARLDQRHGFPPTESAAALGARNDPTYTQQRAAAMGATLASVGVNLNLAPDVDLNVNPTNPIIGALDRSFSADPAVVTSQALAFIAGQTQAGIRTTLKHFPGHGSSTGDTHLGVVDVTASWTDAELKPFASIVAQGQADAILTAHVFNAHLDPQYPATLSKATVTGILREQIGYHGVVVSDDLQMGAIRQAFGYPEAVALAIDAGVDILTIANQQVFEDGIVARTIDIIAGHVTSGRLAASRIDESWDRIQALKARVR